MVKFDPHIPRTRGRLPWPYDPLLTDKQQWRIIAAGLLIAALICGIIYLVKR
jgi:hypothetical protein